MLKKNLTADHCNEKLSFLRADRDKHNTAFEKAYLLKNSKKIRLAEVTRKSAMITLQDGGEYSIRFMLLGDGKLHIQTDCPCASHPDCHHTIGSLLVLESYLRQYPFVDWKDATGNRDNSSTGFSAENNTTVVFSLVQDAYRNLRFVPYLVLLNGSPSELLRGVQDQAKALQGYLQENRPREITSYKDSCLESLDKENQAAVKYALRGYISKWKPVDLATLFHFMGSSAVYIGTKGEPFRDILSIDPYEPRLEVIRTEHQDGLHFSLVARVAGKTVNLDHNVTVALEHPLWLLHDATLFSVKRATKAVLAFIRSTGIFVPFEEEEEFNKSFLHPMMRESGMQA